jgi:hypothetical protein
MHRQFRNLLSDGEGSAEFVIAIFADVRGFSRFSQAVESTDVAMFVKRVYARLIDEYFPTAAYFKSTGDGLLIIQRYSEATLEEEARSVIESCLAAHKAFPTFCDNDPMINFDVPKAIGFSIARGSACCLMSKGKTLDYSGRVLNLAARLLDLARPSGVVFDGKFDVSLLKPSIRKRFTKEYVYLRSVAETEPVDVYRLDTVAIGDGAKIPLGVDEWCNQDVVKTLAELQSQGPIYRVRLSRRPLDSKRIDVRLRYPVLVGSKILKGHSREITFADFEYQLQAGTEHVIHIEFSKAVEFLKTQKVRPIMSCKFRVSYPCAPAPLSTQIVEQKPMRGPSAAAITGAKPKALT